MVGERVEHAIFACALSPSDEMWLLICGGERARNSITTVAAEWARCVFNSHWCLLKINLPRYF
jgi:hypothetical protein